MRILNGMFSLILDLGAGLLRMPSRDPEITLTAISMTGMEGNSCAKAVTSQLLKVPGTKSVRVLIQTGGVVIESQPGVRPSARALWEAVERVGFLPWRLEGPTGIYRERPRT